MMRGWPMNFEEVKAFRAAKGKLGVIGKLGVKSLPLRDAIPRNSPEGHEDDEVDRPGVCQSRKGFSRPVLIGRAA